ncbi:hypothetical protein QYE76_021562 [Lolium multiflorum]|uniref:Leucine-rich repeat-containing N-terminal plant-type domain-containing protein n=1 Tax=Lolium multiflorum TaxID=4521 RepID=A0AAD8R882_LOLMU|nr:hypothetical protein QYE76_021562 [Lolium multiflorum]
MELAKSVLLALLALLAWLAAGSTADDRLTLMSFMSGMATNSSLALAQSSWGNSSVPTCQWRGVTCGLSGRRRGRVVALDLPGLGLDGTIPPELGNLTYLRWLHLPANHLHGILPPELGNLPELSHLNLSYNSFQGRIPGSLSNCTRLQNLLLYSNSLHGEIPPELCLLSDLKEIGGLVNLVGLGLGYNLLRGSIPASLGNLSALQYISPIPLSLGKLGTLVTLRLDYNELEGSFPPSLLNLSTLEDLGLQSNRLSGSFPHEIDCQSWHFQKINSKQQAMLIGDFCRA